MSQSLSTPCPATRRSVLAWTGAGLAAAFTGPLAGKVLAALPVSGTAATGPGKLSRECFLPLLGSDFHLSRDASAGPSGKCRLVGVSPNQLTGPHASLQFISFSLLFASSSPLTEGGIHPLTHPSLPDMELFLSPVGGRQDSACYLEAVFSQRV